MVDHGVGVDKRGAMIVANSLIDTTKLEPDDAIEHRIRQREIGNGHDAPEQCWWKHLEQFWPQPEPQLLWVVAIFRIARQLHDQLAPDIGGEDDQGVLEIDLSTVAIFHDALVEHLEENLMHVGMGLLDFVEQYHAVRLSPYRLGQSSAFAVTDIARRRAFQRRDGVRLLKLRHVDGDHVLLAAIERLGQRQRGLSLADTGGAGEHEYADRL